MRHILLAFLALACVPKTVAADLRTEEIQFASHGANLSGSIVFPAGDIRAAVVFIHGSGKQERSLYWAEKFAREGIAALVYDKRGVGKSGGDYEQNQNVSEKNLSLLADDALAGVQALAAHPRLKGVRLGLTGISQAGWIAPITARRSPQVQFLVMWSGPICKVSEEDIYSKFTADADGDYAPPYAEALRARTTEYRWPEFLGKDTDSSEDLAALKVPGFWIFSDNDRSIPVDVSLEHLKRLRKAGHRYDYALFSGLGHNNMEQTFTTATEWIKRP